LDRLPKGCEIGGAKILVSAGQVANTLEDPGRRAVPLEEDRRVMHQDELLPYVLENASTTADAARSAGPDAPVPPCPEWDLRTLVTHLGRVHRWATRLVSEGSLEYLPFPEEAPGDDQLAAWLVDGAAEFVRACRDKGPDAQAWNWAAAPPTVAFWARRMAHETAVHAWDAAIAAGTQPDAMPPDFAADGIDELLTVMLPARPARGLSGTLHVHCTDADGEWTIDLSTFETTLGHSKGDAALRGPACDVLLRLLNRGDGGEVFGDDRILASWRKEVRL
jgi:uncharacterized protein (TIGR03083 family)